MNNADAQLDFYRFEFKYILPNNLREDLENKIKHIMDVDPFAKKQPNEKYYVRSLYFDDGRYSAYFDKINGLLTRKKFRLRTYTNTPNDNTVQYLELKGRHNQLVFKHRAPLIPTETNKLSIKNEENQRQGIENQILNLVQEGNIKNQFEYELYRKRLTPVALVDYERRPYVSKFNPGFRVTFDDNLQCTTTNELFPIKGDRKRNFLNSHSVMEVKFKQQIPSWFHKIIRFHELQRQSISKICHSMESLELVEKFL